MNQSLEECKYTLQYILQKQLIYSFGTKSLAALKAAAEMVSGFQCLLGKNIDIDIELSHIYDTFIDLLGTVSRKKVAVLLDFVQMRGGN